MTSGLVDVSGKPIRAAVTVPARCPRCSRAPEVRQLSSGFGTPHDVCVCGHEFSIEESRPR